MRDSHLSAYSGTIHNSQDRRSLKYLGDNRPAGTMESSLGRRLGQPNACKHKDLNSSPEHITVQWSSVTKAMFLEKETSEK